MGHSDDVHSGEGGAAADHTVALLEQALAQMVNILAAVTPEDGSLPTPCVKWNVSELVRHLALSDLPNFAVSARGEAADWARQPGDLAERWLQGVREDARRLSGIWRAADLDRPVASMGGRTAPLRDRADQQIAELAVHAWDLVQSLGPGRALELDAAVAEHALGWGRRMLRPEFRGPDGAFGAEVPVPADEPAYDRLAGWFGRDPRWSPRAAPDSEQPGQGSPGGA